MRFTIHFLLLCLVAAGAQAQPKKNSGMVQVILDTDIAGDYDDVGAMALLHAFADKGEANILAVVSCNAFETTVPTISVLNTYFGRPDIPVGIIESPEPNQECQQQWAQAIIAKYPHRLRSNDQAEKAVSLYRRILAAQPDHSVTVVTVGFFTNLAALLSSGPDQHSTLGGKELVKQKVKLLVAMAASLPPNKTGGREYNVYIDTRSSKQVFEQWETPAILSPLEVGEQVLTGIPLIRDNSIQHSPVKDAYALALAKDKNTTGRMSWDQTAVLVAVRGAAPWFDTRRLNFRIEEDGSNTLIPGERFTWLSLKAGKKQELQSLIESLMHHQPRVNK
jgi:inosine-uridine nucleoside N-ribohydrolase